MYRVARFLCMVWVFCVTGCVVHACGGGAQGEAGVSRALLSRESVIELRAQLYQAIENDDEAGVAAVIAYHIDVDRCAEIGCETPLLHAIAKSTVPIVEQLIAACADVNRETDIVVGVDECMTFQPLIRAVFVNREDMVRVLLENDATLPLFAVGNEWSVVDLLKRADQLDNVETVALLLTNGNVDLSARDERGRTILENVIHNGELFRTCNVDVIKTIVLLGAFVDEKEKRRWPHRITAVVESALVEREQSMKNLGLFEQLYGLGLDKYLASTTVEQILADYGKKASVNVLVRCEVERGKRCAEAVELAKDTVQAIVLLPLGIVVAIAELVCDFLYFGDIHPVLLARAERRARSAP